uniref:Variant surface glycoprotein 1125.5292 n=1 Tax=Trypanosoma brucei TaxID=5691 RepID=A0A1J0RC07_9TRYP|nr:variant surface glycoprotein 1125.5292 [Trypanosoma brucei]
MLAAALFLALILTRLSDRSAADIGDGANIYEFKQLCRLAGLARHGIKTPTTTEEGLQAYQKIQELNMTLSPPQWQAMFKKDVQGNEWPQQPPKESNQTTNWAEFWPEWAAAAKAIDNPDTLSKLKKEADLESLSQEQWEGARPSVAALAAKAHETYIKLKEAKAEANNADTKQAAKLIAEAVYGKDQTPEATVDAAASFDGSSDDRGNNCKVTANKPGAKTVVATIICLCARTATNVQKNACFYTNTGTADWNGQKSAAQTQWAAITKYRGYTTEQAEPEATITEALNALTSSLSYSGKSAYLGAFHATGCCGSSTDGVCVEYTIDNNKPEAKVEAVA